MLKYIHISTTIYIHISTTNYLKKSPIQGEFYKELQKGKGFSCDSFIEMCTFCDELEHETKFKVKSAKTFIEICRQHIFLLYFVCLAL
jgi:hypothetical protein